MPDNGTGAVERPLISIIIPVYNMADKMGRCLDSIVGQSFTDFEVLVVDDGSADGTEGVVRAYMADNPQIRYYHKQNGGVSSARNAGIDAARGEYILFIDADDETEEGYLQNIACKATASGADLLVWGLKRCHPDGSIEEWKPEMDGLLDRKAFLEALPADQYGRHRGFFGFVANKMVRKDVLDRYNLRFDTTMTLMEDYDFFLGCYSHCESFLCFSETGYRYNIPAGVKRSGISYPQLIRTHVKCAALLEAEGAMTQMNERHVFKAIDRLSVAMFLEMRKISYAKVKSSLDYLWETPYCIQAVETTWSKWKRLKRLILARSAAGIFVYTLLWRTYMFFRTGGRG